MSCGERRHLVTLEKRTEVLDSFGDATLTYAAFTTAGASIEAVGSRERFESQQVQAEVSHRIKIRYSPLAATLTAADRITYGTRIFDVVTPMDRDGRQRELEILALERP
jgi:SPP1 family predicted phage head-tail adaptor